MQSNKKIKPGTVAVDGARFKSVRLAKKFTLASLAQRVSYDVRTIRRIENGQTNPRYETLLDIAAALEVDWRELTEPTAGDPKETLRRAIDLDQEGKSDIAISHCEKLREALSPNHPIWTVMNVQLATFYDHLSEWESAIGLLNSVIQHTSASNESETLKQRAWARYQRAVIQRRLAEDLLFRNGGQKTKSVKTLLAAAERDLRDKQDLNEDHSHPTGFQKNG